MNIFLLSPALLVIVIVLVFWLLLRLGFAFLTLPIHLLRRAKNARRAKPRAARPSEEFFQRWQALRDERAAIQAPLPHKILGVAQRASRYEVRVRFYAPAMLPYSDTAANDNTREC